MNRHWMTMATALILGCAAAVYGEMPQDMPGGIPARDVNNAGADYRARNNVKDRKKPKRPQLQRGNMAEDFLNTLTEEEKTKFRKMAAENPEAFRKEMLKRIREAREKELNELKELRQRYLTAKDDTEKETVRKELESALLKQINRHTEMTCKRIEATEKQLSEAMQKLQEFKRDVAQRKVNQSRILERMMKEMTDPEKEPAMFTPPQFKPKHDNGRKAGPPPFPEAGPAPEQPAHP